MKTALEVKYNCENNILCYHVTGEIDSSNYEIFKNTVFSGFSEYSNIKEVIFDLKYCSSISSNGFGIFYEFLDTIEKRGFKLKISLINTNPLIFKIIKLLKMYNEFNVT
ncbi:STAS domain-containing protein [Candidatus Dependentiae bacterium]|nr:STAS domain-containing protein [Candidatus Dependentiae bacterium]